MGQSALTGFFGVNNFGDDIMLDAFYNSLNNKNAVTLLRLYTGGKIDTLIKTSDLSYFSHGKRIIIDQYHSRVYNGLFWIGGTCMTDNAGDGAYSYMSSFKNRGKQIGYIGIGINEIKNKKRREIYKCVLDNANIVTLRDKKSYDIAKSMSSNPNIFLTEDLVYLSDYIKIPAENKSKCMLLIAWRSLIGYYDNNTEEKAINSLIYTIKKHRNNYDEIVVTSLGNSIDYNVNRFIFEKLHDTIDYVRFVNETDYKKRIQLILSATTVITGRLHGLFVSEWNNINTVAIGYDTKISCFLDSIGRNGDLLYPDSLDIERIEDILSKHHEELTVEDWKERQTNSYNNVKLFEELTLS